MSSEVIESVFRYSDMHGTPLMLIASKNQIDWDGGYVNGWSTAEYVSFVKKMQAQYPKAAVLICRDHCGPGFKNYDLADVYKTIDTDLENGFDLIHVDFCHHKGSYAEILEASKKAIERIHARSPNTLLEVGTDENTGKMLAGAARLEDELKFFTSLAPITFFVVQSGSLVKELRQVGDFNAPLLQSVRPLAERYSVLIKEHNADYLSQEDIKKRNGLVDAMNVAPQYGVIQTMITIQKAILHGVDSADFLDDAYASGKWKKWLQDNTDENRFLCSLIAGHYVFANDAYRRLYDIVSRYENLRESIVVEHMKNIRMYVEGF